MKKVFKRYIHNFHQAFKPTKFMYDHPILSIFAILIGLLFGALLLKQIAPFLMQYIEGLFKKLNDL